VPVHFLIVYIQTRQTRLSAMGHPARMVTEVLVSTCCPIPIMPFGGLEINAAVLISGRPVAFKIRTASAFKFKIDGLDAPDRACAGRLQRREASCK
jgi:hypothetical protein